MRSRSTLSVTPEGPFDASVRSRPSMFVKRCSSSGAIRRSKTSRRGVLRDAEFASPPSAMPTEINPHIASATVQRSLRAAKTAMAVRRKRNGTAELTGGKTKIPAVMPAQRAIAGIAAGHRTTAGEQKFCPQATGYRLPATGYRLAASQPSSRFPRGNPESPARRARACAPRESLRPRPTRR
jgi:hypothetical protein